MSGFRRRQFDILVATDIAARGIDVAKVSHVINFDMPATADAYTHRIGRTGRSGCDGKAYTFVTSDDQDLVRAVERRIGASLERRAPDGVVCIPSPGRSRPGGSGKAPWAASRNRRHAWKGERRA